MVVNDWVILFLCVLFLIISGVLAFMAWAIYSEFKKTTPDIIHGVRRVSMCEAAENRALNESIAMLNKHHPEHGR